VIIILNEFRTPAEIILKSKYIEKLDSFININIYWFSTLVTWLYFDDIKFEIVGHEKLTFGIDHLSY